MTIRMRLTLWYAGVLFISILSLGSISYYELIIERRAVYHVRESKLSPTEPGRTARANDQARQEKEIVKEIREILLWYSLPAAFLGLLGGALLTRKFLSPISALTQAAERITEHNLSERLAVLGNGDELDRLTHVFNAMTARLADSFLRIREFTLHASHELKTPLTVLHGELETALENPSYNPEQREALLDHLDEVQRLTRIVDGLTLLMKADSGLITLSREQVKLDELVQDAFADAQVLARPSVLHVELLACEELTVLGDRHRLRQLLLNLTDNAIKYNIAGGRVSLSLRRDAASAEILVANTGPGIPEADRHRVFERFYRGEIGRRDEVEGSGLGLSIAKWIVVAHGGTIRLLSGLDQTTTMAVRLPLENA